MVDVHPESPLAQHEWHPVPRPANGAAGVTLREHALLGHLNLRGDVDSAEFVAAVGGVIGVEPPKTPNTLSAAPDVMVLWLGPDEWLIVTSPAVAGDVAARLESALRGLSSAFNDISGGQTLISVSGVRSPEVIAKGCTLDIHPSVFSAGQCAQTHLAKAAVVLRPQEGSVPGFDIVVRRSFADYLWRWLLDAAGEYGIA